MRLAAAVVQSVQLTTAQSCVSVLTQHALGEVLLVDACVHARVMHVLLDCDAVVLLLLPQRDESCSQQACQ
jgi:hypothetical protein